MKTEINNLLKKEEAQRNSKFYWLSSIPLFIGIVWLLLSFFAIRNSFSKLNSVKAELANATVKLDKVDLTVKSLGVKNDSLNQKIKSANSMLKTIEQKDSILKQKVFTKTAKLKLLEKENSVITQQKTDLLSSKEQIQKSYNDIKDEIASLTAQKKKLEDAVSYSQARQAKLKSDSTENAEQIKAYNQIIKKAGIYSNESKFHPGATKTTTGKSHLRTEQFDFEVFINGDIQDLNDIKSVTYNFNSETLKQQIVTSTDPSSKFKVGYLGWGCLSLINITINLKNGTSQQLIFNMCEALGG